MFIYENEGPGTLEDTRFVQFYRTIANTEERNWDLVQEFLLPMGNVRQDELMYETTFVPRSGPRYHMSKSHPSKPQALPYFRLK